MKTEAPRNNLPPGEQGRAKETGNASPQDTSGTAPEIPADAIIIIPVRNTVLFPGTVLPLSVGRERSVAAAQDAARNERPVGILLQRNAEVADPGPGDLHEMGTVAGILRYVTGDDGAHHIVCQGLERFRIVEFLEGYPFLVARIDRIPEPEAAGPEIEARLHQLRQRAVEALQLLPNVPQELIGAVQNIPSAPALADFVASVMDLKPEEKQDVLTTVDLRARLDKVLWMLAYRIEVLRLSRDIGQQTREAMESRQREHLLREQLRTIQRQLGEA